MKAHKPLLSIFIFALILMGLSVPASFSIAAPYQNSNLSTQVFINEIHYDNAGTDTGEAVEVFGPAGFDLTDWKIVRYNGSNGLMYTSPAANPAGSDVFSGTIPDVCGGFGVVVVNYLQDGLQNGSPDAIALVDASNVVVQFLSYEGSFTALDGPAVGMTSTDIGVAEDSSTPVGHSLQLTGTGSTYSQFTWASPQANTFGAINTGQTCDGGPTPTPEPTATPEPTPTPGTEPPALVINEIDYDQPGTDAAEFIELRNNDSVNADLSNFSVELVNGTGGGAAVYQTIALPASVLAPGDYFVICANVATVPNCDLDVLPDTNLIQNGAPDAVALRYNGMLVDTVSYEGDTGAPYTEGSGVGLEDNSSLNGAGISRCPDGSDTNQNNVDFSLRAITPGSANVCQPALVINEIDYDQPGTDSAEFIEIRNNDIFSHTLSSFAIELVNGNNGGAVLYQTISLPAVDLAPADYFVVCANAATVANCDLDVTPDTNLIQNGAPDAVGLRYNGLLIDTVSYEGDTGAPYTEGSGAGLVDDGVNAADGISRCPDGVDTNQNNLDFLLRVISPGAENICADDIPPTVASTNPVNGAANAALNTDITITFSENVTVSGSWFDITCSISGSHPAVVSGGLQSYTLNPDTDFVGGDVCTTTIYAANVVDLDGTPDNMVEDYTFTFTAIDVCSLTYTPIYDIQGSDPSAAITGVVTTQGVVVGDYEYPGTGFSSDYLRGFYIQDPTGDGNSATSDGIFVFNGDNNNVNLGDLVRVTGTAGEFQDQTQLSSVTSIAQCGTGTVSPVDMFFPVPSLTYLEQFEGMLVRLPQTMYVTEHFQLGRFGQVLLSSGARLQQPTHLVSPGAPAIALLEQNNLNKILLDDHLQVQNPDPILFARGGSPLSASNTLRGGDTATGIVGVMTYTWSGNVASGNAYRLRPINALGGSVPDFQPTNPRPESAPVIGGTLNVVGFNVLNYFNTFGNGACTNGVGGTPTDCRGADNLDEFNRQWPKTISAILAMDPDVLGIVEIENDGYGANSAIQDLVNRLNDATAPGTYAFIDVDAATGEVNALGLDAIKVGVLYKVSSVTPVGQTSALNSVAFVNGGDSVLRNRPALAQAFEENASGSVFIVSVNHFKSKGSPCEIPDAGDGQGNCNQVRVNAATELVNWLATDPTGTGDTDVLLIGDYNSYAKEDPIVVFQNAGFTNLIEALLGTDAYSFVFDGQWGYLDYALASSSLVSQVTGVADYHINADEPNVLDYNTEFKSAGQIISLYAPDEFRVSDHDPLMVGLDLETVVSPTTTFYLHGRRSRGQTNDLFLDTTPPDTTLVKQKDSGPIKFAGGNPWKEIGTWSAEPVLTFGTLTSLEDLQIWLGLKKPQDHGANVDVRVEVYKNNLLVASTEMYCITGLSSVPELAQKVTLQFGSFAPVSFDGFSDILSVKFLTRMGSDGSGNSCGGNHRANGLRLYFDAIDQPSSLDATITAP